MQKVILAKHMVVSLPLSEETLCLKKPSQPQVKRRVLISGTIPRVSVAEIEVDKPFYEGLKPFVCEGLV